MAEIAIDASAFQRAAHEMEKHEFDKRAGQTVAYAIRRSSNVVRRNVRAKAKPHRVTGKMASHVEARYKNSGLDFEARIFVKSPVAHLITGGVKPHDTPMNEGTGALTVRSKGKNGQIVALVKGSIHHPGFRGDPFFQAGVTASEPDIDDILAKSADTMVRDLAYRMGKR